ncbi:ATP-binding protein [Streptomyces candidus]|uniref:Anti-sigma regulatory factor (Ser/Thr protein kinase) n=1 Tax=Streptomyces candidus TaxID=67283 RepID=A0A7X0LTG6_9ACTN|nr:ATP-binding protein [Streptomyces candidus]MBB6439409.1 anti-sigma regulatory factor (Ser/Thr protein kinase) [Streptomyces candidus]
MYELDSAPSVPATARREVRAVLTDWQVSPEAIDTAVQVISEIAANAVEHTLSSRVQFEVGCYPDGEIHVAVRDSGPRPEAPLAARTDGTLKERGRGLLLVDTLTSKWGAEPVPENGLLVWAMIQTGGPA